MNLDELFMMLFDREKYLQLMKKKTPIIDDTGYGDFQNLNRVPQTRQGLRSYDPGMLLPFQGMPVNPWQSYYKERVPPIETQQRRGTMPRPHLADLEVLMDDIDKPSGKSF
jgi:hypothetical protein